MNITPAIKGQLTKAAKLPTFGQKFRAVRAVFIRYMPRQQAKHATRKYLSHLTA